MSDYSDDEVILNNEDDLFSEDSEVEVLPSEDEDDEDEDDYIESGPIIDDDRFSRFKIQLKKEEMASDLEDDDNDEDDALPSAQAWGKDKKSYYHTDYIDKDFRSQKQKDEDLAQYEEEEALQIQKRLLDSFSEKDLGLNLLIENDDVPPKTPKKGKTDETITILPVELSDSQKITMIKQESPELELLISDFKKYLIEIQNELEPLLVKLDERKVPESSGLKYLKLRLLILSNYCTNITFYLSMKCSSERKIVKDHPIIKRLFIYKKLIKELDSYKNPKFSDEVEFVKNSIANNKKLNFMENIIENDVLNKLKNQKDDSDELSNEMISDEETVDQNEKRAITYEMQKNKGLTPKRKREQRNPRVKYRKKFEKAVIRRKGQVREPRKELKKYGGEITGINVHAVKSVKFK